ncbi:MAG: type IV secretory system conjugative DNA transfer family protein [Candidatus Dormibacteraeota bacterium]|nr:type IV secretory system conjugative DNA transfer family protein [Candidatus Dormibacteraeota bacterium]
MLVGIALAVPAGLLARSWWYRTPFDISARLARRLSVRARLAWYQRPFLGWTFGYLGQPRWAMGTNEDSVGVIGPPRVNKTAGIALAQLLSWGGPLISVAPKPELFRLTAHRRRRLAKGHSGKVIIYAPTESGRVEGLRPVRFSPADSRDLKEITLRVDGWLETSAAGQNVENADHWRAGAGYLLRGLFLAAAHHRVRPGDFTLVYGWLSGGLSQDPKRATRALEEPIQILRDLRSFGSDQWADDLEGMRDTPDRERASFFSAARTAIKATANPAVLRSTTGTDFDPERFLLSCSTLYIVSPTEHQKAVAPLIAMLVHSIVHTAYRLHREGRLPARLLLSLDDLANCCPLPQLESTISQGGGQGVNVAWNLQSFAQLRDHFGDQAAEAIWSATRCKVIFGGLGDQQSLDRLAGLIQEEKVRGRAETVGADGKRHRTTQESWRPLLSAGQLREVPDCWALLLYHNDRARMLRQPLAAKCHQFAGAMVAEPRHEAVAEAEPVAEV